MTMTSHLRDLLVYVRRQHVSSTVLDVVWSLPAVSSMTPARGRHRSSSLPLLTGQLSATTRTRAQWPLCDLCEAPCDPALTSQYWPALTRQTRCNDRLTDTEVDPHNCFGRGTLDLSHQRRRSETPKALWCLWRGLFSPPQLTRGLK